MQASNQSSSACQSNECNTKSYQSPSIHQLTDWPTDSLTLSLTHSLTRSLLAHSTWYKQKHHNNNNWRSINLHMPTQPSPCGMRLVSYTVYTESPYVLHKYLHFAWTKSILFLAAKCLSPLIGVWKYWQSFGSMAPVLVHIVIMLLSITLFTVQNLRRVCYFIRYVKPLITRNMPPPRSGAVLQQSC